MDFWAGGIGTEVDCGENGEDGLEDGLSEGSVLWEGKVRVPAIGDKTEIGRNAPYWPEQGEGHYMYFFHNDIDIQVLGWVGWVRHRPPSRGRFSIRSGNTDHRAEYAICSPTEHMGCSMQPYSAWLVD